MTGGLLAVLAAVTFGTTTPFIQKLGRGLGAFTTASLLYAGAALASASRFTRAPQREAPVRLRHLSRLAAVALVGAVFAPVCLAWGLQRAGGSGASLLLNFEAVFTVFFAWCLYREPVGRRVLGALTLMILGGACLVVTEQSRGQFGWGALAVVAATMGWALDNALTRPLADLDPTQVVRWKGALGAVSGLALALIAREPFPSTFAIVGLLLCGATGYGLSLRLYLLAQRRVGAGRTGSIFALAPFVGAGVAWVLGDHSAGVGTVTAGALFGGGVYLHLTEAHHHRHTHVAHQHEHGHRHDDEHHDHRHSRPVVGQHTHVHEHDARSHEHPHGPDLHHDHRHD